MGDVQDMYKICVRNVPVSIYRHLTTEFYRWRTFTETFLNLIWWSQFIDLDA